VVRLDRPSTRTVLAVSTRRESRRDVVKDVEQLDIVEIAAVENDVDAGEGLEDLRPQGGARLRDVGVGEQTDPR
jgi:hypothetical protein